MKKLPDSTIGKILLLIGVIISGIIWGLGQYPSFYFLRFFAFIPFLFLLNRDKINYFYLLIFGTVAYIINFYWLYITFYESGKIHSAISILIIIALCVYYGIQYLLNGILYRIVKIKIGKLAIFIQPLIFFTIDFLYLKIFNHQISDSLIGNQYLIQFIDLTGMTGLTLIIFYFNVGLYLVINDAITIRTFKPVRLILLLPLIPVILYGVYRIDSLERIQRQLPVSRVVMIQGNISGKQKLDENFFEINLNRYNDMTKKAIVKFNPDLIVWPESIFNRAFTGDSNFIKELIQDDGDFTKLEDISPADRNQKHKYPHLIMGIVIWGQDNIINNSALLIRNRRIVNRYDKQKLVPFGEFVPFEKQMPFLRKLSPFSNSTSVGKTSAIFNINQIKAAISICYEDIFPDLIRKHNIEGSNLMINLTNDSWYGKNMGPLHHSILGRLRAIENRRSFYRCTATGLTTASDLTGKIISSAKVWSEEIVFAELPLYSERTLYSYTGDLFAYLTIAIAILFILYSLSTGLVLSYRLRLIRSKHRVSFMRKYLNRSDLSSRNIRLVMINVRKRPAKKKGIK